MLIIGIVGGLRGDFLELDDASVPNSSKVKTEMDQGLEKISPWDERWGLGSVTD